MADVATRTDEYSKDPTLVCARNAACFHVTSCAGRTKTGELSPAPCYPAIVIGRPRRDFKTANWSGNSTCVLPARLLTHCARWRNAGRSPQLHLAAWEDFPSWHSKGAVAMAVSDRGSTRARNKPACAVDLENTAALVAPARCVGAEPLSPARLFRSRRVHKQRVISCPLLRAPANDDIHERLECRKDLGTHWTRQPLNASKHFVAVKAFSLYRRSSSHESILWRLLCGLWFHLLYNILYDNSEICSAELITDSIPRYVVASRYLACPKIHPFPFKIITLRRRIGIKCSTVTLNNCDVMGMGRSFEHDSTIEKYLIVHRFTTPSGDTSGNMVWYEATQMSDINLLHGQSQPKLNFRLFAGRHAKCDCFRGRSLRLVCGRPDELVTVRECWMAGKVERGGDPSPSGCMPGGNWVCASNFPPPTGMNCLLLLRPAGPPRITKHNLLHPIPPFFTSPSPFFVFGSSAFEGVFFAGAEAGWGIVLNLGFGGKKQGVLSTSAISQTVSQDKNALIGARDPLTSWRCPKLPCPKSTLANALAGYAVIKTLSCSRRSLIVEVITMCGAQYQLNGRELCCPTHIISKRLNAYGPERNTSGSSTSDGKVNFRKRLTPLLGPRWCSGYITLLPRRAPGSIPVGSPLGFSHCGIVPERCRLPARFLGYLPFPPPLYSGAAPYSPRFTLIGSQDLDVNVGLWCGKVCFPPRRFWFCHRQIRVCGHASEFSWRSSMYSITPSLFSYYMGSFTTNNDEYLRVSFLNPGLEKQEHLERTRRLTAMPATFPACGNPGALRWESNPVDTARIVVFELSYARLHYRGSKLDQRSDLRSTQKTVAPFEFRAGLEIKMKSISNRRNWWFEISIRDQQPSIKKFLLARHFYIGTKIKLDLGSGKMLVQPGIRLSGYSLAEPLPLALHQTTWRVIKSVIGDSINLLEGRLRISAANRSLPDVCSLGMDPRGNRASKVKGAIRATLTRTPSASSLLRASCCSAPAVTLTGVLFLPGSLLPDWDDGGCELRRGWEGGGRIDFPGDVGSADYACAPATHRAVFPVARSIIHGRESDSAANRSLRSNAATALSSTTPPTPPYPISAGQGGNYLGLSTEQSSPTTKQKVERASSRRHDPPFSPLRPPGAGGGRNSPICYNASEVVAAVEKLLARCYIYGQSFFGSPSQPSFNLPIHSCSYLKFLAKRALRKIAWLVRFSKMYCGDSGIYMKYAALLLQGEQ
ncbi:hypothetical protein PR048_019759 [Dryococelus australis]|uniref:Uncharacterized protein n=1 Tax=Dryococelus australis TaxID=614101 RepID=A0ABQ9H4D2_9NEOP|nr:hypothetical protein PR048_019759 [Dryococelus australis]